MAGKSNTMPKLTGRPFGMVLVFTTSNIYLHNLQILNYFLRSSGKRWRANLEIGSGQHILI